MPQVVPSPQNEDEVALMRPLVKAGIPTASDGAGFAPKGKLCIDYTNGVLYINTGTLATPAWTKVGVQT